MNTLPPEVANAFRLAAITALQELVQVEVFSEDSPLEFEANASVIATIHLLHEPPGKLLLVLSESTAVALATRYLPAGTEVTTEIVDDVAGEFANVIAGQAKTMLKGTPYHFHQTTPAVTHATSLHERAARKSAQAIHLSAELGAIELLIELR
jgi:CheY-specific phosphatase CheX